MKALSLTAIFAALIASPGTVASQDSPVLELKGLRLGMPSEEVKASLPSAECEGMAPGLERCSDPNATINERKAHLDVYFMDGTLLSVSYQRLLTSHAQGIGELLTSKFGQPSFRVVENAFHLGSDTYDRRPKSTWDRGGDQLQVIPFALHDRKADNTFSTVRLIQATRWDNEWLPRLRAAQDAKKRGDIDTSKADI